MIVDYIQAALDVAHYEIIDDPEPYYGEVSELPGVYATGATLEACRHSLSEVIEGWLIISLKKNLPIPTIKGVTIDTNPNPHHEEISVDLLSRILRQAGIERTQWLNGKPG